MLSEDILDEILISEVVEGVRTPEGVPADASDVDGTNSVNQGLIQLELEIGRQFPEKEKLVESVRADWDKYKTRRGAYASVIHEAVRVVPELFRGLKRSDVQVIAERVAAREVSMTYAFPRALYAAMRKRQKANRRLLVAITGSPHDYAVALCKILGFDAVVGCWMEVDKQGRYTGVRDENPAINKGAVMDELTDKRGLYWLDGIALGDSPTDIPMFERCSYRLAINPTQDLQKYMRENLNLGVVWVNDHQKTGTQIMTPDDYGRYRECDILDVLPLDLAQEVRGMPGMWRPC